MARFIYRMQSILNIKAKMEEQAKNEFAAARIQLDEEEEKLLQLKNRKLAYEEEGRELQKNNLQVRNLLDNHAAIERIKDFIVQQQICVQKAESKLEKARLKLQNARQESKTQERLREKAFEEFVHEENAKEAKEIDELTSYTHSGR